MQAAVLTKPPPAPGTRGSGWRLGSRASGGPRGRRRVRRCRRGRKRLSGELSSLRASRSLGGTGPQQPLELSLRERLALEVAAGSRGVSAQVRSSSLPRTKSFGRAAMRGANE